MSHRRNRNQKDRLKVHPKFEDSLPDCEISFEEVGDMEPEFLQELLTGNCHKCGTPMKHYGGPLWACPRCFPELEERHGEH